MRSIVMNMYVVSDKARPNFTNFSCTLPTAVVRSSSDGVAIRYVLPVLWMTTRFHTMGSMMRHVHS